MKPALVLDIEDSPMTNRLLLVGMEWLEPGKFEVIEADDRLGMEDARSALADPDQPWVTFTKYDKVRLARLGIHVAGPVIDLQTMAWVLNENTMLTLEYVAKRYAGVTMDKRLRRVGGVVMFQTDTGRLVTIDEAYDDPAIRPSFMDYNRRDVETSRVLFNALREQLKAQGWWDYWLREEVPFTQVLVDMELAGLPVNLAETADLKAELEVEAAREDLELHEKAGLPATFNLGSNDQMAAYLYGKRIELHDRVKLPEDPWQREAVRECLLSAGDDPHIDCGPPLPAEVAHVGLAFVPHGFTVTKVGREYLDGYWSFPGRGLKAVTKTPNGEKWSVSTPTLLIEQGDDPWVRELVSLRKKRKVITTYLKVFLERAKFSAPENMAVRENERAVTADRAADGSSRVSTAGLISAPATAEGAMGEQVGREPAAAYPAPIARIYAGFNQTGTVTGRLSSSGPNLQNLPARGELGPRVRRLIQGDLLVADYSQLEPRLMAHFSGDPTLMRAYINNEDVYVLTATNIIGRDPNEEERLFFKVFFLSGQYGAGLAKQGGILALNGFPTPHDRMVEIDRDFRDLYSVLYEWKDATAERAKRDGYVTTLAGRHRRLNLAFQDRHNWRAVGRGERQAINSRIQGSAADVVKHTMMDFAASDLRRYVTLLAQVHDELVTEARGAFDPVIRESLATDLQRIGEQQASRFGLRVPLVFEPHWGTDWASAKAGGGIELDMEAADSPDSPDDEEEDADG